MKLEKKDICLIVWKQFQCKCDKEKSYCNIVEEIYSNYIKELERVNRIWNGQKKK